MGERRTARPSPSRPVTSIEERLAGAMVPQYAQTGVVNSTDLFEFGQVIVTGNGSFGSLTVTSTGTILSLAVTSGLTVGGSLVVAGSTVKSMAYRSATGADAIMVNSSWQTGPVSSSQLRSTAANLVAVDSSWQNGPVSSTQIRSTDAALVLANSSWQSGPVTSTALNSSAAGIVAVNSSWRSGPVASTALTSTAAAIVAANSSWQSGPVNTTALTSTNAVLSGSSINSTPIGVSVQSTGKFTEITGSSGSFNTLASTGLLATLAQSLLSGATTYKIGASSTGIGGIFFGSSNADELNSYFAFRSWTPTDASGATLSFTVATGRYIKIGRLVLATFDVTYPATGDASQASFTIPFTSAGGNEGGIFGLHYTDYSTTIFPLGQIGSGSVLFHNGGGAGITNAGLSGKTLRGGIAYIAAS